MVALSTSQAKRVTVLGLGGGCYPNQAFLCLPLKRVYRDATRVFLRSQRPTIGAEAVIEALENPHDRRILALAQDQGVTAQEIIDETGIPKSTVYRRLNRLRELELITVDGGALVGGHAIDKYRARVRDAEIRVRGGQVEAHWELDSPFEEA